MCGFHYIPMLHNYKYFSMNSFISHHRQIFNHSKISSLEFKSYDDPVEDACVSHLR